jgi:hypothetical protein
MLWLSSEVRGDRLAPPDVVDGCGTADNNAKEGMDILSSGRSRHRAFGATTERRAVRTGVATGSAGGTIGAYRLRHGLARGGETFILHQGRCVGRPSALRIQPEGTAEAIRTVKVGGDVALVGHGTLDVLP